MKTIIIFKKVAIQFHVGKKGDLFWYVDDEKYEMRYTHYISIAKVNGKGFVGISFVFLMFIVGISVLKDNP